jgi:hypothetical protein
MPILSPQLTREGFRAKPIIGHGLVSSRNDELDTLKPNNIQYQLSKLVRVHSIIQAKTRTHLQQTAGAACHEDTRKSMHLNYPIRQWSCSTRM